MDGHNNGLETAASSNGREGSHPPRPSRVRAYFQSLTNTVHDLLRHFRRNEHRNVDIDGDNLNRFLTALLADPPSLNQAIQSSKPEFLTTQIDAEYTEDQYGADKPPDASDGNNKHYRKAPFQFIDKDWGLGWTDGRSGQPLRLDRPTLEAGARLELKERVQEIGQLIAVKVTRFAALKDLLDRREEHLKTTQDFYEKLSRKRNANYLEFSRPLGYLYLVFGILLFLADVPLSLKLVASGFQVPVEAELPEGVAAIGSTTKLLIDHLLIYPRYVIGLFWESLALAGGIAFVGIIVKYYVDLIVLRDKDVERPRLLATVVLTVILFGFIGTVFLLGNFRAEQQMQADRRQIDNTVRDENQKNQAFNENNPTAQPRRVFSETEIVDEVNRRYGTQSSMKSAWLIQTFIALTILLPVVGGVCFSASGARFRNAKQYWLAFLDYKKAENERDRLVLQIAKEQGDVTQLTQRLQELKSDPDYLTAIVDFKLGVYQHGYARGRTIPETVESGASLYERCESAISKLLSRKAQEKVYGIPK